MKTTVNNIASENVTSFVINEDMLNEKKAMKYISKPNMVAAINDICAAIKGLNSLFSPQEYTEANSKKELFDAYHRFYIIYTDLRDAAIEARHREEEKKEREERRRQAEIEKNTKELIKPAQPLKSEEEVKEASKANKKAKADKAPKKEKKASIEGEKKTTPRVGDAEARLSTYSAELAEKEALVANAEEFAKLSKEDAKAIRHRIASLKRKIERANKALGINTIAQKNVTMKTKEEIEAHRRTCEHFNTTLLGDGLTCCTADLRALPTWQDPGGDGMVYPCGDDCPFMKQFINEDKDEDIETNHSDGRA